MLRPFAPGKTGVGMRKSVIAVGACVALGGCALPVPIQVASWAIDVISVVTTEKSITDHGISALTQQDCAIHRAVTQDDNEICRAVDDVPDAVLVATATEKDTTRGSFGTSIDGRTLTDRDVAANVGRIAPETSAASKFDRFQTAAGVVLPTTTPEQPVVVNIDLAALQPSIEAEQRPFVTFASMTQEVQVAKTSARPMTRGKPTPLDSMAHPRGGFYYVIGSFRGAERAKRHMVAHNSLAPAVLKGRIGSDKREVYRVVVGPYKSSERKAAYRRIKRSGVADTWAIRVTPKDWSVAAKSVPAQEVASVPALSARDWPGLAALTAKSNSARH